MKSSRSAAARPAPISPAIRDLLSTIDAYCLARGVTTGRASTEILGAGHRYETLRTGGDIGVQRLAEAMQRLSDKWPEDAADEWPIDVARPTPN